MKHLALIILGCVLLGPSLTGCGIKPSTVDAPEGSEDTYPRTYPDRRTDPPPPGPIVIPNRNF